MSGHLVDALAFAEQLLAVGQLANDLFGRVVPLLHRCCPQWALDGPFRISQEFLALQLSTNVKLINAYPFLSGCGCPLLGRTDRLWRPMALAHKRVNWSTT
jgi:hypothetical protein